MDHLLSVLGLLLIVRDRMLLLTAMPPSILFPLLLVDLTLNGPTYIVLPVHDPGALYCRVTRDNRVVHTDEELVPGDEVDARRLRKMYDQWSSGHQVETAHHCLRS